MSTPSLLNIPYLYKAGTLYSQIPESGAGDFSVTRATTPTAGRSTRVNKDGLIELVADNVPRLDYPLGGAVNGCPALLVEPAATNLFQRSQELNGAYWTPSNVTVTPNSTGTLDPFGGNNAELVTKTSGINTVARISRAAPFSTTGTHTLSVFAKASVGNSFSLRLDANGITANTSFTFSTKTLVNSGANVISSSFQEFPNGWFRISLTANVTSTGWVVDPILLFTNPTNDAFWVFGAQLETGSVATSYIPTTTGSVTRNADVISVTGAVSGSIGQTEGTLYAEVETRLTAGTAAKRILTISNGNDADNRISIGKQADDAFIGSILSGGVAQAAIASTTNQSGSFKIALAFKANDAVLYINGTQIGTDTSLGVPSGLNRVDFGQSAANAAQFNDRIRAVELYPNRLSNAQLATLTAL